MIEKCMKNKKSYFFPHFFLPKTLQMFTTLFYTEAIEKNLNF